MKESAIEKLLVAVCKRHGALCWKFTSPGLRGVPDRIVVTKNGTIVFCELKKPAGGVVSAQQKARQDELLDRNAHHQFILCLDDIYCLVSHFLE